MQKSQLRSFLTRVLIECSGIMRYMGDEPIRRGETLTDAVYRLLLICHKNPALRDEVYCQIIRQTTNNKSAK